MIGHTDCEMAAFTNDDLHARLRDERYVDAKQFDFRAFSNVAESVAASVRQIAETPLLPND